MITKRSFNIHTVSFECGILKLKIATSYHGDIDAYQGLYESTNVKLFVCHFSCFCQILHNLFSLIAVLEQILSM